jgi:integrase
MNRSPYLVRRGSTYYFRVRTPVDLRATLGRAELSRSLRTATLAEARRRSVVMLSLTDRLWSALHPAMTPEDAKPLVDQWLTARLEEDADIRDLPRRPEHATVAFRRGQAGAPDTLVATYNAEEARQRMMRHFSGAELVPEDWEFRHALGPQGIARHTFSRLTERAELNRQEDDDRIARPALQGWLRTQGVAAEEGSQGFRAGVRFMLKAQVDLAEAVAARDAAHWYRWGGPDPARPYYPDASLPAAAPAPSGPTPPVVHQAAAAPKVAPSPPEPPQAPEGGAEGADERIRFSVAAAEALREIARTEKQRNMRKAEYAKAVELFSTWLGADPYLDEIGSRQAGRYKVDLTYYPKNATKRKIYRAMSMPERIAHARAIGETGLMEPVTINTKYLTPLRRIFAWLIESGRGLSANPFQGVHAASRTHSDPDAERREFTDGEVAALLAQPVFTGSRGAKYKPLYQPGRVRVSDWRFWVPLISLYSGMRLNEACALAVADIKDQDGVPYMHVRDQIEGQNAKSNAARRKVPIHRELLAAGFLDFVEQARRKRAVRLFPDLQVNENGYVSDRPSKFFLQIINRARDPKVDEPGKLVFHSTRHTVVGKLRSLDCREDISTEIVGHEKAGTHARYGKVAMLTLQRWVNAITYEGVDMGRVKQPYSTWRDLAAEPAAPAPVVAQETSS